MRYICILPTPTQPGDSSPGLDGTYVVRDEQGRTLFAVANETSPPNHSPRWLESSGAGSSTSGDSLSKYQLISSSRTDRDIISTNAFPLVAPISSYFPIAASPPSITNESSHMSECKHLSSSEHSWPTSTSSSLPTPPGRQSPAAENERYPRPLERYPMQVDGPGKTIRSSLLSTKAIWNFCKNDLLAVVTKAITSHLSPTISDFSNRGADISKGISLFSVDPIARGGFCDLYLGSHKALGLVALRRPRCISYEEAVIRRFHREVGLLCKISHPNILPFFGTCTIGQDFYMVSPYIKNGNLLQCIQAGRSLDRLDILSKIGGAVAYLHRQHIVHGDIKAQNILISEEGIPLLCDFGLAKALDSMVTSTDVKARGSARWMAPELFDNAPKTRESDVYAFGMTIAEVLTGKPPFADIHEYAVVTQILNHNAKPQRPTTFNDRSYDECWEVAEKCWVTARRKCPSMDIVLMGIRSSGEGWRNWWDQYPSGYGGLLRSTEDPFVKSEPPLRVGGYVASTLP